MNGYTDWYLPSKDELNKLYLKKVEIDGLVSVNYWSSTEADNAGAWLQYFADGGQNVTLKDYTNYVRAVRAF